MPDEPLPIMDKSHVRVIVLVTKEAESKEAMLSQPENYVNNLNTDKYLQQEHNVLNKNTNKISAPFTFLQK